MTISTFEAEHKLIKRYVTSSEYLLWTGETYLTQSPIGDIFVKGATKLYFVHYPCVVCIPYLFLQKSRFSSCCVLHFLFVLF